MNAASYPIPASHEDQVTRTFLSALKLAIGDAESAAADARHCQAAPKWRDKLRVRAGGMALGTSVIPGLHGYGIILELPYLFRLMGRGAIGTGELMGAEIESESDLPAIFALWSGAVSPAALASATGGVVVVDGIAYPAFGAKVLAVGFKIGVKAFAGLVPLVGAGVSVGISLYILNGFLASAETYYEHKIKDAGAR